MPHEWKESRPAGYKRSSGPMGRPKPPEWTCTKCGTRADSWLEPSENMKVRIDRKDVVGLLTCEECQVFEVMTS
jgi:hypothetical protein